MTAGDRSIVERIESRCHWVITIRPADLVPDRIPDRDLLYPLVRDSAVLVDGRYFPAYDAEPLVLTEGPDWVQFDYQWLADLQSWRFFQSGQLTVLLSVWTEWTATPMLKQPPNPSGPSLPISDSLFPVNLLGGLCLRRQTRNVRGRKRPDGNRDRDPESARCPARPGRFREDRAPTDPVSGRFLHLFH